MRSVAKDARLWIYMIHSIILEFHSLPYVVDGAAAITYQNKLYLIGGGSMATVRDSVFELNSTSNTWIQKASMPTARVGLRLLEHEGKIWAIGGYHATNGAQSIVEIYDPSSDSWVSGTSLNTEGAIPLFGNITETCSWVVVKQKIIHFLVP